ncbi:malate synthase [Scopulibacillus daqui]|uniref:Malate synthase n=1 Tax=Scopulibacillus daqui TaxID=1469162 RepID=A0ABS2PW54_9BACL|nr:malate synthase A [Scopulibacillus daqui]MBM7644277.1 malate synthase [Scopulibacillus daqui]
MTTTIQYKEAEVTSEFQNHINQILTPEAIAFLKKLHEKFNDERMRCLKQREVRQHEIDNGKMPDFLPETESIRQGNWTAGSIPDDLKDRRVEITGPASDRKMVINALNSGAYTFMADIEDATSPTWENIIQSQMNLKDAVNRSLSYTNQDGKQYTLNENIATLIVRPRGWHLDEKHFLVNNEKMSASLFDFGLYLFHNTAQLLKNHSGPYFYLPKIESREEARLWNQVFTFSEQELGIEEGTIKATVLIETILAAFEADEILYELKEHIVGLNCGRWDYIFSYLKKFRNHQEFILPDRSLVTMTVPFMKAYTEYVVQICHKRKAHAIGGMAAQIPIKNNPEANEDALNKVRMDKTREVMNGHDGSWVAHPGLVQVVLDVFNEYMPEANQIDKPMAFKTITASDLLEVPAGPITEKGLRTNIHVAIQYIAAWLNGKGAVPINHLMEDAATAEISRAQVWQWLRHPKGFLDDGRKITESLVEQMIAVELIDLKNRLGEDAFHEGKYNQAAELFSKLVFSDEFIEFLTIPGYDQLS